MKKKINISVVSYLNSKPFLYGLFRNDVEKYAQLSLDIPSECARKLVAGEVDLGLVPVAVIPQVPQAQIVSEFCIGTEGAVKTVCIFGECPIEEMEELYLDYHSRTSAGLTRVLLHEYWGLQPRLLAASKGYLAEIKGRRGGLVIGDRTIGLAKQYPYVYDLGEIWKAHTGLPFVFAAWVSNQQLPEAFLATFNSALADGIARIPQVAQLFQSSHLDFNVLDYYTESIAYQLDQPKQEALQLFLQRLLPSSISK